jgi:predicted nucleotidyltransferase
VSAPASSLRALRAVKREAQLAALHAGVGRVLAAHPSGEVGLFGSLARGDWDADSDVDLLAVTNTQATTQAAADNLADALLDAHRGDDVVPLTQERWQAHNDLAAARCNDSTMATSTAEVVVAIASSQLNACD